MKSHAFAISILAAVFGVLGATVLAIPDLVARGWAAWGFASFFASNVAWLTYSAWQRQWPLHVQQWVFLATSVLGLWNWWLVPLVRG